MQPDPIFSVLLPIILVIIMLGLGLSLRVEDFTRVVSRPKTVFVALVCQTVLLPVICFGIVTASSLPPAIAVGMMLLAASPGGPSAVLYTHLARGDTALSLTLTGMNSVLTLVSLPLITNFSLVHFYGAQQVIPLQFGQFLQFFALAIVPAVIGMIIQRRHPLVAARMERPVKTLAVVFLAAVVLFAIVKHWELILTWGPVVGLAALTFNLASLAVGYFVPRLLHLGRPQAIAVAMATGVHNAAFVITLALSEYMLNNSEMAVPPALYALIAYVTAAAFVYLLKHDRREAFRAKPAEM